jgi:hypothetical protein
MCDRYMLLSGEDGLTVVDIPWLLRSSMVDKDSSGSSIIPPLTVVLQFLTVAWLAGGEIMVRGRMVVIGIIIRRLVKPLDRNHTACLIIDILDPWLEFESHT